MKDITVYFLDGGGIQYLCHKHKTRGGFLFIYEIMGKEIIIPVNQIKMIVLKEPVKETPEEKPEVRKFEPVLI